MSNFFQNTCKPQGIGGKIMVNMMNNGHAKMAEWGLKFLKLKETDHILDIGCGGGANIAYMLKKCSNGTVNGIKRGKCDVICGSVMELPFEAEQFDVVTAFETVYFWPALDKAFEQVYKVLKAEGTFFICNEINGKNQTDEKWTKMIDGMAIYTSEQLVNYLKNAGFTDIKVQENHKSWLCVTAKKNVR